MTDQPLAAAVPPGEPEGDAGRGAPRDARMPRLFAAGAALLAVASLAFWWERARTEHRTVDVVYSIGPGAASELDCPVDDGCRTVAPRGAVIASLTGHFPGARLIDGWRIVGTGGATYREDLAATTANGDLTINVSARCQQEGVAVADRQILGEVAGGRSTLTLIRGGRPGCSVAVTLTAYDIDRFTGMGRALAAESDLQIPA
jgi:hypothetical protein